MNKQIEELRKDIYGCNPTECCFGDQCEKCSRTELTKALYDKGYRKQSDTAREIISDIEMLLSTYTEDSDRTKELRKLIELIKRYLTTFIRKKYEVTDDEDRISD